MNADEHELKNRKAGKQENRKTGNKILRDLCGLL